MYYFVSNTTFDVWRREMPDYEKMYHMLFNAITDALEEWKEKAPDAAAERLRQAQCDAEEMYIQAEE